MASAFTSALLSSFSTVLVSEIGDKTFFIAAILAMKQSRLKVPGASVNGPKTIRHEMHDRFFLAVLLLCFS